MPARSGYEHTPEFWWAYLAASVGDHLHGNQHEDQLADDYERTRSMRTLATEYGISSANCSASGRCRA